MLVQMLFRDVFIILMERLDIHFFIWKQKGRCVDLLEKSHSVVNVPYSCLQLSICSAYAECGSLLLMYRMCYQNLDFKFRLVCPTYALQQVLHVILYIPLFSCSCNRAGAMGFMRWCNVVVVLNAMPIFAFLNKLVNFLIFRLWNVNVVQIFFVILASFFVVDFVQYFSVKFQQQVLRKVIVLSN